MSSVKRFCQSSISHLFHSIASFSCFTQHPPPPTLSSSPSEISSIFSSSCASYPSDRSEVNGKPVRENSGGDWGGSSDYRSQAEGLTGSVSGGDGLNTNGPENQCPLCGGRGQSLIQSPDTCTAPSPPMTAFHVPSVGLGSTNRTRVSKEWVDNLPSRLVCGGASIIQTLRRIFRRWSLNKIRLYSTHPKQEPPEIVTIWYIWLIWLLTMSRE